MTFVDEGSGYVRAKSIKKNSCAVEEIFSFIPWIERHTGNRVIKIVSDVGGEYLALQNQLKSMCIEK